MQLREIVNQILEKKFSHLADTKRPLALANEIKVSEMDIRRAAGMEGGSGRNQEKIFRLSLKVLDLCKELEIDPAQELLDSTQKESSINAVRKEVERRTIEIIQPADKPERRGLPENTERNKEHISPRKDRAQSKTRRDRNHRS